MNRPPLAPALAFLLLLAVLVVLYGCEEDTPDWYPSKVRAPGVFEPLTFRVSPLPAACDHNAWGCYVPEDAASATPGRIYILKGLHPNDDACVLRHERRHWAGMDHKVGFSDCEKMM